MRAIIIGNGVAGMNLASGLRKLEPDPNKLRIDIHAQEPHDFYARVRLPEAFRPGLGIDDLILYKADWYEKRAVQVFKNHPVKRIDPQNRKVFFDDGGSSAYDVLAICAGADPLVFPIPGIGLPGIRAIRSFEDALWVRDALSSGIKEFAVLGGGLLGIEAAKALMEAGAERVSVVEAADRLLSRQLDDRGARILRNSLERTAGLSFRVGARVERFEGEGRVESIALSSGESITAGAAILSTGIAPRISLAREAGLAVGRGIVVDEYMRSSAPGIFSAGDAAEFRDVVWGIIPVALDQAQAAARAMLGDLSRPYVPPLPRATLKVGGIDLLSLGTVSSPVEEGMEVVIREDADAGRYEKYLFKDGLLAGAIVLGSKKNQGWATAMAGKPARASDAPAL
jgi:nitrite reductase (NADH) large subunit